MKRMALMAWKTRKPIPHAVWNKITEDHCEAVIELALEKPDLSPRELAVNYTDNKAYFVSEFHGVQAAERTRLNYQSGLYPDGGQ